MRPREFASLAAPIRGAMPAGALHRAGFVRLGVSHARDVVIGILRLMQAVNR